MEFIDWDATTNIMLFKGATELHMAFYMDFANLALDLIDKDFDKNAKASWPGLDKEVTPGNYPLVIVSKREELQGESFKD